MSDDSFVQAAKSAWQSQRIEAPSLYDLRMRALEHARRGRNRSLLEHIGVIIGIAMLVWFAAMIEDSLFRTGVLVLSAGSLYWLYEWRRRRMIWTLEPRAVASDGLDCYMRELTRLRDSHRGLWKVQLLTSVAGAAILTIWLLRWEATGHAPWHAAFAAGTIAAWMGWILWYETQTMAFTSAARAEPPLWIVEDHDSTIYLFGTVHALPADAIWRTESIDRALATADELWIEIVLPADMAEHAADVQPLILEQGMSQSPPLSSRLSDSERNALARAVERAGLPPDTVAALDVMRPWFATATISVGMITARGFDPQAGVDVALAKIAREQGDSVHGFETVAQQLAFFSSISEERQMQGLRGLLATPELELDDMVDTFEAGVEAWLRGDAAPIAALIVEWKEGVHPVYAAMPYELLVAERNEDWAVQIQEMLSDSGTVFVAVGAGHLVGPDSVLARLRARGISVQQL